MTTTIDFYEPCKVKGHDHDVSYCDIPVCVNCGDPITVSPTVFEHDGTQHCDQDCLLDYINWMIL